MGQNERVGFRLLHEEMRPLIGERKTVTLPSGEQILDASKEWCYKVTPKLATLFRLLAGVPPERRETHQKAIEALLVENLGHPTVLFRYKLLSPSSDPTYLITASAAYTKCLEAVYNYVWGLAQEFPVVEVPQPGGHPDQEREYVAMRLGRGRAALDTYVSEWRSKNGADLPWVVRKPGLPWMVHLARFEEWRCSSEGDKATVKKRVGRPPKFRISG